MYVPFAFDLVRVEQEGLRRRTALALHRDETVAPLGDEWTRRTWTPRRFHRRPAAAC